MGIAMLLVGLAVAAPLFLGVISHFCLSSRKARKQGSNSSAYSLLTAAETPSEIHAEAEILAKMQAGERRKQEDRNDTPSQRRSLLANDEEAERLRAGLAAAAEGVGDRLPEADEAMVLDVGTDELERKGNHSESVGNVVVDQESRRRAVLVKLSLLYGSHFLSAWGDRMWQFVVPLLFMEIFKTTLMPTAVYTMVVYIAIVQLMPLVGHWVDVDRRLTVQRVALTLENASIVMSTGTLCLLVAFDPAIGAGTESPEWSPSLTLAFIVLIFMGILGETMNQVKPCMIWSQGHGNHFLPSTALSPQ